MSASDRTCPICGPGIFMKVTHTRPAGPGHKRRYRSCEVCDRRDTVLIRVEEVVEIRVLFQTEDAVSGESNSLN